MRILFTLFLLYFLGIPEINSQKYTLTRQSSWNFGENINIHSMDKDSLGFLWIGTNTGLYRFDGLNFERFPNIGSEVRNLVIDAKNNLWITSNSGLIYISAHRDTVRQIEISFTISKIQKSASNKVFGLSNNGGFYMLKNGGVLEEINLQYDQDTISCISFDDFVIDQTNDFWLKSKRNLFSFSNNGQYLRSLILPGQADDFIVKNHKVIFTNFTSYSAIEYDLTTKEYSSFEISREKIQKENQLSAVFEDAFDNVIFSYYRRLFFYREADQKLTDLSPLLAKSAPDHIFVYTILSFTENTYFLGTNSGLFKLNISPQNYKTITKKEIPQTKNSNFFSIRKLFVKDTDLYIGSYSGFYRLDKKTLANKAIPYYSNRTKKIYNPHVYDMIWNGNEFIIASETTGLMYYDENEDRVLNLLPNEGLKYSESTNLEQARYFAIIRDKEKYILGSDKGVYEYSSGELNKVKTSSLSLDNSRIYDIKKVQEHIYIGSSDGLYRYEESKASKISVFDDKRTTINYILGDRNLLWLGTRGDGLVKFNVTTGKSEYFGYDQGLIDLSINGITYGNDGGLWFSTNLGVSKLDTASGQVKHFFANDELGWNEFNHNAICSDTDGNLYFGGIAGVVYFNPLDMTQREIPSKLLITKIAKRKADIKEIVTEKFDQGKLQEVNLAHNDRFFSIEFAKSDLGYSQADQFQYRISGNDWIDIGNSRAMQFTDLNPGNYVLEIAGSNAFNSTIAPLKIPIKVNQVFYKQWWAWMTYVFIFIGLIAWIFRNLLLRSKLQSKLNLEQSYNRQLQDLAETKTQIFSNLAHEFQTPLTLIQGPAAKIEESATDNNVKKWSRVIIKNAHELMEMIQQMLKLSRLDEGLYTLDWTDGELNSFLKEETFAFQSMADEKNIDLKFYSNGDFVYCKYDKDKLVHILKNLISNAIKFTPPYGKVNVEFNYILNEIEGLYQIEMLVSDSGIGISNNNIPKIFDRFYQSDGSKTREVGGTGIGLALVKEFVDLLNGSINLESKIDVGTTFKVCFDFERITPFDLQNVKGNNGIPKDKISVESIDNWLDENKNSILIVEDNLEVRDFIKDCLKDQYEILEASNGMEGLDLAINQIPDLIITDVMMPKMDGYTLVSKLKQNELCIQIPCVMLTAKSTDEDRLQSRKSGVEAFLAKPFMPEELMYIIDNLLRLKENVIKTNKAKANSKIADPFIQNLLSLLKREMDNSDLNVNQITQELAISRTQLHRKIKALTGKSINQFIREFRLEKAKELLESGLYNVNEVCYKVGYTQPSYFSARFKEYFGELPSNLLI